MQQRLFGYFASFIGLVFLIFSIKPFYSKIGFLQGVAQNFLMLFGVVLVIFGVILINYESKKRRVREFPIYE